MTLRPTVLVRGRDVRRLAQDQVARVELSAQRLADHPASASALHAHRREARRLLACVDVAEWAMTPTRVAHARALATSLPRGLGRYRDADVLLARLADAPGAGAVLETLRAEARDGRKKAVARACRRTKPRALRKPLGKDLGTVVGEAWGDALGLPLARLQLRAEHALRQGGEVAWHALRLEAKRLRDGATALTPCDAEAAGLASIAKALADPLGRWRDAAMAVAALAKAPEAGALLDGEHVEARIALEEARVATALFLEAHASAATLASSP